MTNVSHIAEHIFVHFSAMAQDYRMFLKCIRGITEIHGAQLLCLQLSIESSPWHLIVINYPGLPGSITSDYELACIYRASQGSVDQWLL